jgi:hypothetical protein
MVIHIPTTGVQVGSGDAGENGGQLARKGRKRHACFRSSGITSSSHKPPTPMSAAISTLSLGPDVSAGIEALSSLEGAALTEVVRSSFAALSAPSAGSWAPPALPGATEAAKAACASLCTLLLEAARLAAPREDVRCVCSPLPRCLSWDVPSQG